MDLFACKKQHTDNWLILPANGMDAPDCWCGTRMVRVLTDQVVIVRDAEIDEHDTQQLPIVVTGIMRPIEVQNG